MGHATAMLGGSSGGHSRGGRIGDSIQLLDALVPLLFHPRGSSGGTAPTAADGITVLAQDSHVSAEIVASDTTVYWVDRGLSSVDSIVSVPLEGGPATILYACEGDGVEAIPSLAFDSGYVYWVEQKVTGTEMSFVKRMRAGGGAVESILTRRGKIKQIAVDATFLYSVDEISARATRLADGQETGLGPVRPSSQGPAIAAWEGGVYWLGTPQRFDQAILTAKGPTFDLVSLGAREATITAMSAAGPDLYWLEYAGPNRAASVFVMDRAGGAPGRIFESNRVTASSSYGHALIASDADGVYFMVDGAGHMNDGAIYQGARSAAPRLVVSGIGGPGGLAASGDFLVFSDVGEGVVVRVPK